MVRRVKAYLKTMKVITDEDELHKMSLECEPPLGGIPAHPHPPPMVGLIWLNQVILALTIIDLIPFIGKLPQKLRLLFQLLSKNLTKG